MMRCMGGGQRVGEEGRDNDGSDRWRDDKEDKE